jgi:hypothetical protein
LEEGNWRGNQKIGVITSKSSVSETSNKEVEQWVKASKVKGRVIMTKVGTKIELREAGLGTALIVRKRGQRAEKIWTSDMENCYGLVPSPDEQYVAFICELNGVVIMRLNSPK